MTAKELKENAKRVGRLANDYTQPDYYYFLPDRFQDFCNQLCKEQRENLLKACNFDSDYQYYFATADEILNAPTPDL